MEAITPGSGPDRNRGLLAVGAVFVLALLAHHQVLANGFVNYDDPLYVTSNARVQAGFTFAGLAWAATAFEAYNWHPLTWISHMADVELWGVAPRLHHLTSLLLHASNAVLLLLFLRRATGSLVRSAAVAAIFAVHPIHVESVAWVAERKDVLFAFFYLATLLVYSSPRFPRSTPRLIGALALFACSLLSKPMAVSLPVVLILLDGWPLDRLHGPHGGGRVGLPTLLRSAWDKVPFIALALGSAAITVLAQGQQGQGAVIHESPVSLNVGNALISFPRYLGKAVWPADLAVIYPFRASDVTASTVSAAALTLATSFGVAWLLRRRAPYVLMGLLWFVVTLLPVIGVIRIGRHAIADRYAYVPFIGLYVVVVWGASDLAARLRIRRTVLGGLALAALALLTAASIRQSRVWRTSRTLFEHALVVTHDNAVAQRNLGIALAGEGDYVSAARHGALGRMLEAREVVELHPANPIAHYRLGNAYVEVERYPEAVEAFRTVVRLDPASPGAWNNLGVALGRAGRPEEALHAFAQAVRLDPADAASRANLRAAEDQVRRIGPAPAP